MKVVSADVAMVRAWDADGFEGCFNRGARYLGARLAGPQPESVRFEIRS
jgi:hypothetical protein